MILKKSIIGLLLLAAGFLAVAQEPQDEKMHKYNPPTTGGKYCVAMKDGKPTVTNENGRPVTGDVQLGNGSKLTTDGTLVKADGSKQALESGKCVDKNGMIVSNNGDVGYHK
jgi:hypothetical protein